MTIAYKNMERAAIAAAEYRRLVRLKRFPEADQVARTINELVGYWNKSNKWTLPVFIRNEMGI